MPFVRYLWREFFCAEKLDSSVTVFSVFFPFLFSFFQFILCDVAVRAWWWAWAVGLLLVVVFVVASLSERCCWLGGVVCCGVK